MRLPDIFDFTIRLPYFCVHTEVMNRCHTGMSYIYYEFHIQIYKWCIRFSVGDKMKTLERRKKKLGNK